MNAEAIPDFLALMVLAHVMLPALGFITLQPVGGGKLADSMPSSMGSVLGERMMKFDLRVSFNLFSSTLPLGWSMNTLKRFAPNFADMEESVTLVDSPIRKVPLQFKGLFKMEILKPDTQFSKWKKV